MNKALYSPLIASIFRNAELYPDKVAIISVDDIQISYGQLISKIKGVAAYLQDLGIKKGDRLMLSAQKELEFVYLYFGAHLMGAVNVVVDAQNNASHLDYIADEVSPSVAFGFESNTCKSVQYNDVIIEPDAKYMEIAVTPDDLADVMFTSGTTGTPKGVKLTHYNIFSSADNINGYIRNDRDDIELLGLPVCHSFGLGRLRCNMLMGATIILRNGFANLKSIFQTIEQYKVTGLGMVPAVWSYIRKFSGKRIGVFASQIKYIEIGSAAMPLDDKKMLMEIFPDTRICMHYGLTEASRAVFLEFHENADNLLAVGRVVSDAVTLKLLNDNHWIDKPRIEGEICIKGNMVTKSYYKEEDNHDAFIDGYFRTGDWGVFDESGCLHLIARKKELINVGGKKVSPIEIEDALESIGVGESMCVAVADPDGILGDVPKVFLLKGSFSKELTIEKIKDCLRTILEAYKMPRLFEIVDSIPKTASGKKKRIN